MTRRPSSGPRSARRAESGQSRSCVPCAASCCPGRHRVARDRRVADGFEPYLRRPPLHGDHAGRPGTDPTPQTSNRQQHQQSAAGPQPAWIGRASLPRRRTRRSDRHSGRFRALDRSGLRPRRGRRSCRRPENDHQVRAAFRHPHHVARPHGRPVADVLLIQQDRTFAGAADLPAFLVAPDAGSPAAHRRIAVRIQKHGALPIVADLKCVRFDLDAFPAASPGQDLQFHWHGDRPGGKVENGFDGGKTHG